VYRASEDQRAALQQCLSACALRVYLLNDWADCSSMYECCWLVLLSLQVWYKGGRVPGIQEGRALDRLREKYH